jgi:hypothetical protein
MIARMNSSPLSCRPASADVTGSLQVMIRERTGVSVEVESWSESDELGESSISLMA